MSDQKLAWGILALGGISHAIAKALKDCQTGYLLAVASRSQEKADKFGAEYNAPRRYGSYEALLADPDVQVVYIALPNHLHAEWTIKAAQAGKHILCEKPIATNPAEAMVMLEAVRRAGVCFLEAFMYRCSPQTAKLVELLQSNAIGEVRHIETSFSYNMGPRYENIRLSNEAAGGGIMDVGCYCMSMARLVAGAATGKDVAEPIQLKAVGQIGSVSRVDEWSTATALFPGNITANLFCGTQVAAENALRIYGSKGSIHIPNPWFPGNNAQIIVRRDGQNDPEEITISAPLNLYTYECDLLAQCRQQRQVPSPAMTWSDSLGNIRALERWRQEIGLAFNREKPDFAWPPSFMPGKILAPLPGHTMTYGRIAGIDQPVSRIILGTMGHITGSLQAACAMIDTFVEHGGNALDTAYVYGTEAIIGKYLAARGIRNQMVIVGKGAHTPDATPEGIRKHIAESLERCQLDYFDLWLMHRDNMDIPVEEFVDCLNEQKRAGKIRAFGGSNWTVERLAAANSYARRTDLTPFAASSPNLAVAAWNEPMWSSCVAASNKASRDWHAATQLPVLAWSSQASGFLSGAFSPADSANPALRELVRVWFNDDNFRRLERVRQLATRKNATCLQLALAWVLCQPFPTFALIGPQNIDEMRESLGATSITLTPDELTWLNLEK